MTNIFFPEKAKLQLMSGSSHIWSVLILIGVKYWNCRQFFFMFIYFLLFWWRSIKTFLHITSLIFDLIFPSRIAKSEYTSKVRWQFRYWTPIKTLRIWDELDIIFTLCKIDSDGGQDFVHHWVNQHEASSSLSIAEK